MISVNEFARMVIRISGKTLAIKNIDGPIGVRGRTSDNALIHTALGWTPSMPLEEGMRRAYSWVTEQVRLAAPMRSGALGDAALRC
jgi:GDP-D-mannose 3', 5'-epimerase